MNKENRNLNEYMRAKEIESVITLPTKKAQDWIPLWWNYTKYLKLELIQFLFKLFQ